MKKSKSILWFVVSMVVIAASIVVSIFGIDSHGSGSAGNITLGLDLQGGVSITYEVQDEDFTSEDLADTIYKLQLRVAEYSSDATVYQEGTDRIVVEIPGVYDTETVIENLGSPGSLQFVTYDETDDDGDIDYDSPTVWLEGDDVESATAGTQTNSTTGATEYVVNLVFTDEAAEIFAEITETYLDETIYILYDDEIISAPTVESTITDGNCIIEGMEDYEEAATLASTIRIGNLSLTLEHISSKVVSAKLGSNAVRNALIAGFIALALIIIFLIFYYRIPGVAAALSLVFFTAAELILVNAFDLTLSISGIAGIILSIGMAVDGNVIINARIKEELLAGRSVDQAIKLGFKKSTSAILDGNITTLIVAVVLIIFGSGSVQGFGYTLAIGIVMSVITSLLVARLLMYCLYGMGCRDAKFYAKVKKSTKKVFDFVGKRLIWFIIAIVCIVAGVVAAIAQAALGNGIMNFNIEFVGGYSTTVEFEEDYSMDEFNDEIKAAIAEVIGTTDIEGQKSTGSTEFTIKTPELDLETWNEMKDLLVDTYGADEDSIAYEYISSTVSTELMRDALVSLAIAGACMLLYIWIRFRKFKFALSSLIALIHDVLIVASFYALFRLSVGSSFVACILTIVGYSINATIVIFDRIRENSQNINLNYDLKLVINTSIWQSLSRSILTSATTFIMVAFLYILGVETMRAFALPLAIGVLAGAFSSIFISGSLYYTMTKKKDRVDEARKKKIESKNS